MSDPAIEIGDLEVSSSNSSVTGSQAADLVLAVCLILCSALFSGLTLGLMSLDISSLKILEEAGEEKERLYAKRIIPLRRNGNLLLCTLLIGNTIVNSCLSILLASITSGAVGVLVSTAAIVIFGEITPQAVCSRHGLMIGSMTRYITWACVGALFVIAWPISKVLDWILGREVGTMYSKEQLKQLIKLQVIQEQDVDDQGKGIHVEERKILEGALEYGDKLVQDVMTPADKLFMLDVKTKLTFDTIREIYEVGYTRIPVYDVTVSKDIIVGILYVKDLILADPQDAIEVGTIINYRGKAPVRYVSDQKPLKEVFKQFKSSHFHIMIAVSFFDPDTGKRLKQSEVVRRRKQNRLDHLPKKVTGVISLEDVIEEVIQHEIIDEHDEHDTFVESPSAEDAEKAKGLPDMVKFLKSLDERGQGVRAFKLW